MDKQVAEKLTPWRGQNGGVSRRSPRSTQALYHAPSLDYSKGSSSPRVQVRTPLLSVCPSCRYTMNVSTTSSTLCTSPAVVSEVMGAPRPLHYPSVVLQEQVVAALPSQGCGSGGT